MSKKNAYGDVLDGEHNDISLFDRLWGRKKGRENPDPTPIALPIGVRRPPTLQEQIARLVRDETFRAALERHELESLEEADDFDIDDDTFDPTTPYETDFDMAAVQAADKGVVQQPPVSYSGFVEERPDVKRRLYRRGSRPKLVDKPEGKSTADPQISEGDLPPSEEV